MLEIITLQKRTINCPLFETTEENECLETRINFNNYFSEERTLDRLKTCDFYFENIKTVAFEEVRSEKSSGKNFLFIICFR